MISTWDHTVTLLSVGDGYDDRNPVEGVTSKLTIFAKRKPTNRREFYQPVERYLYDETFVIHPYSIASRLTLRVRGPILHTIVQATNQQRRIGASVSVKVVI